MKNNAQELEIVTIMQGLEEFATFMSYKGNNAGLRILSVTSIDKDIVIDQAKQSTDILVIQSHRIKKQNSQKQKITKSLSLYS
ncbi:MAG: hypothetical protein HRT92_10680 [Piscirickettsiaceae bacterium]|nr:hypothetical protein [Piscirickettsiaceae bacterium]